MKNDMGSVLSSEKCDQENGSVRGGYTGAKARSETDLSGRPRHPGGAGISGVAPSGRLSPSLSPSLARNGNHSSARRFHGVVDL